MAWSDQLGSLDQVVETTGWGGEGQLCLAARAPGGVQEREATIDPSRLPVFTNVQGARLPAEWLERVS